MKTPSPLEPENIDPIRGKMHSPTLQGLVLDTWKRMAVNEDPMEITKWVQMERQKSMAHKAETLQKLDKLIEDLNNARSDAKVSTTVISNETSKILKTASLTSNAFGPHVPNLHSPFDKCLLQGLRALIRKQSHCAISNIMAAIEAETLACITTDVDRSINRTYSRHLESASLLEDEFSLHQHGAAFVEALRQCLARVELISSHIIGAYYRPLMNKVTGNVNGQPMVVFVAVSGDFMQYCLTDYFVSPISSDNDNKLADGKDDILKSTSTKTPKPDTISGGRIKFNKVSMGF